MRMPNIMPQPAQILRILRRRTAELLAAVRQVMIILGQMGMQTRPILTRQHCRLTHQITAHTERRTRRHGNIEHTACRRIVILLNQALRILQNKVFFFNHAVRRQTALTLPNTHAAARSNKAHTDPLCGLNAVVQAHAIGVNIKMIATRRATAHQQFGHSDLRANLHHLRRKPCPDRVQTLQPTEQFGILHLRNRPRQRLIHMVMRVNQTRRHQMPARINDLIRQKRFGWQVSALPDKFDSVIPNVNRSIA